MIHAADDIGERGGFLMLSSPALSYEATAIPGRDKRGPPVSSQNRKESPVFGEERACPLHNRDDVYDHIKDALRGQCTVTPSSALGCTEIFMQPPHISHLIFAYAYTIIYA